MGRAMSRATRRHWEGRELFEVRMMKPDDADALGQVMFDAIHHGMSPLTVAERLAWLTVPPRGEQWKRRLAAQDVWVACDMDWICGFMTLDDKGFIDLAFVAAAAQGKGAFSEMYRQIENMARNRPRPPASLRTNASLMAQPAFAAQGFHVIRHKIIERSGQRLEHAEMEKHLT
jgi:putative acetyltransferase